MKKPYWKPQHEAFIRGKLTHGDKLRAYREAYPNISPTAVRQAANRLMNHPYIRQRIEPVLQQAREEAMEQLEQTAGKRIATELSDVYEQRKLLAAILRGDIKLQRTIRFSDHTEQVADDLDPFVVLRAIELDCKLQAGYQWPSHDGLIERQLERITSYLGSGKGQGVPVRKHIETDCPPKPLPVRYLLFPHPPSVTKNEAENRGWNIGLEQSGTIQ